MNIKKLISCIIVSMLCLSLICCKGTKGSVAAKESFSCKISLNYSGMDIKADVVHHAPGLCDVSITEPTALKGFDLSWQGGDLTVKLFGMSLKLKEGDIPEASFVPAVLDAMDSISSAGEMELACDETGEKCIYEGSCPAGSFRAMIDNETGALYAIDIPDYGIYVNVTDFKSLDEQ